MTEIHVLEDTVHKVNVTNIREVHEGSISPGSTLYGKGSSYSRGLDNFL